METRMGNGSDLPVDNEGWFKRLITENLKDLKDGHVEVIRNQREMHEQNIRRMEAISKTLQEHEEADQKMFNSLNKEISDLQPVKKAVYAAITLILVAFMGGLIALVITKR